MAPLQRGFSISSTVSPVTDIKTSSYAVHGQALHTTRHFFAIDVKCPGHALDPTGQPTVPGSG